MKFYFYFYFRQKRLTSFFIPFCSSFLLGFLSLNGMLLAMDKPLAPAEDELYKTGIVHRDKGDYADAVESFLPLAKKGYARAEHNLAFCYYHSGNELEAYHWYQHASSKGLEASSNNLKKMNLLYLLLMAATN